MFRNISKKKLQSLIFFALIIFIVIMYQSSSYFGSTSELYLNEVELLHNGQVDELKVPVYIVDEHHEVIPYWFGGIEKGLLKRNKNILIHIDGHSDMATPDDFQQLKKFKYKKNSPDKSYFPLMQSNDVFIQSAIFYNLINNVVWVKPSWSEQHNHTEYFHSYAGVTVDNDTKKECFCSCETNYYRAINKNITDKGTECVYMPPSSFNREEKEVDVAHCEKIKSFKYISIGEDKVLQKFTLTNAKHIIVDIDEDYFGVESGVQKFLDFGISMTTLFNVNDAISEIFLLDTNEKEIDLNEKLKAIFKSMLSYKDVPIKDKKYILLKKILELKIYFNKNETRVSKSLHDLIKSLVTLPTTEIKGLSEIRYCLTSSPRMIPVQTPTFEICHGNLFPNDELNQFFTPTIEHIEKRGQKLTEILTHISKHSIPQIFTICRSLRDGYTPRYLQTFIEKTVLKSIETALKQFKRAPLVIYDDYLLNGEHGWKLD